MGLFSLSATVDPLAAGRDGLSSSPTCKRADEPDGRAEAKHEEVFVMRGRRPGRLSLRECGAEGGSLDVFCGLIERHRQAPRE